MPRRPAPAALWAAGVIAVSLTLIPAWYLAVRSTERGSEPWERMLESSAGPLMMRSLTLAAVVAVLAVAVALPAAWLTARAELPGRRLWSVLLAGPLAIPSYITAMTVVDLLGPKGIVQGWLEPFGVERMPEIYGFWGAAFVLTIAGFPYLYLVLRAALLSMDPSEEEASRSLGVGPVATFFRVVLGPLGPAISAGLLLVVLYVLSDFGAVSTLNYETFTRAIYIEYQSSFDRTGAAVLGVLLAAVSGVILVGELVFRGRAGERSRARTVTPSTPIRLGRWGWAAAAYLALVVVVSLGVPVGVLVYWLISGLRAGTDFPDVQGPAWNSISMAAGGAVLTVVLALAPAILAGRFGGGIAGAVEQLAYLTHALPGIVVALALVFFGIGYAPSLYQTRWMLLIAYATLFLPNALSALRASLARHPVHLEDAAASLGRGPARVVATVSLPLSRPGVVAALALVFLTIMKELPATLLLSPPGFDTLPGMIWSRSSEARHGGAALPALILIFAAAVPVGLLVWKGETDAVES